jgi:hypothetical protein
MAWLVCVRNMRFDNSSKKKKKKRVRMCVFFIGLICFEVAKGPVQMFDNTEWKFSKFYVFIFEHFNKTLKL